MDRYLELDGEIAGEAAAQAPALVDAFLTERARRNGSLANVMLHQRPEIQPA